MSLEKTIAVLEYNRDMCFFDPTTGENDHPINKDCEELAEAIDTAIKAIESRNATLTKILDEINTPNRGTCDYFIVDRIEAIIKKEMGEGG